MFIFRRYSYLVQAKEHVWLCDTYKKWATAIKTTGDQWVYQTDIWRYGDIMRYTTYILNVRNDDLQIPFT